MIHSGAEPIEYTIKDRHHETGVLVGALKAGIGRTAKGAACIFVMCAAVACLAQTRKSNPEVKVTYEEPIHNGLYPELLYWFVTPETLNPQRYTSDVQHIAHDTLFDFPFLTARNGVNFTQEKTAHEAVAWIARLAHEDGIRVGVTLSLGEPTSAKTGTSAEEQTAVADGEALLDAQGAGTVDATIELRSLVAQQTTLLRAWVFRKTGPGEYDAGTLTDVTSQVSGKSTKPGEIFVTARLGPQFADYTLFVLAENWYGVIDLFNPAFTRWIHGVINEFRDIPLDGTALDEFGFVRVPNAPNTVWHGHFAGQSFAARFQQATGTPLSQAIFETRYAPSGHPEVRIRAIDEYWDFFRNGPLAIEGEFFGFSRQVFGDKSFGGIHDTFHNHLTNDEAWATGINWWMIPRQYGMSDEDLSLPLRMGLLVAHPGNIMYDQFYGFDIHRFAEKALNDARFNARIHYHGYNDAGRWGVDLSTAPFLSAINPVESKIRLLNRFNPASPELPLLVVFGMPALLNWYPDPHARNNYDINGSLHIEEKAKAIWDAGYRCAVVPSDLIDNGALRLDAQNHPVLNGHTFRAVAYLYPQYAKRSTLAFLSEYTRRGGSLMIEGSATRDFDGEPIGDIFGGIAARATVTGFSVDKLPQLGIGPSQLRDIGGELEDGSAILTDLNSLESHQAKTFSLDLEGHHFSGSYEGVFALKTANDGTIEKLACGACGTLSRDGRPALLLAKPADLILIRNATGAYEAVVEGSQGSNAVRLYPAEPLDGNPIR